MTDTVTNSWRGTWSDFAIEVLSPSNTPAEITAKVAEYLVAGTRLVWVVDPATRTVTAYAHLFEPRVYGAAESVDADDVVAGFSLDVGELFAGPGFD